MFSGSALGKQLLASMVPWALLKSGQPSNPKYLKGPGNPGSFHRQPTSKRSRSYKGSGYSSKGRRGNKRRKISKKFAANLARALTTPNYYIINNGVRYTVGAGIQGWFCPGWDSTTPTPLCGCNDLNAIGANVKAGFSTSYQKYYLKSAKQTVELTNQGNGIIFIDKYNMIFRKDSPIRLNSAAITTFTGWMSTIFSEATVSSGVTNGTVNTLGLTLYQMPEFTRFVKILGMKTIQLGPGEAHRCTLGYTGDREINSDYEADFGDMMGAKGLARMTVLCIRGAPQNDSTTKTSATVASGQCVVDAIITRRYTYEWVDDTRTDMYGTNNIPTSFAVNESIMNEDTGAAVVGFSSA